MGPCPPARAAPVVTADSGAIPKRPLQGTVERQKDDPEEKTREDRETGASETGASETGTSEDKNAEVDNRGARDSHTDEVRQDKEKPPVEVKNDGPRDQERSKYTLKRVRHYVIKSVFSFPRSEWRDGDHRVGSEEVTVRQMAPPFAPGTRWRCRLALQVVSRGNRVPGEHQRG